MTYTKNTWKTGDIVTSEKLNHIEDGIMNSENIIMFIKGDSTLDKTWQEIYDAMKQGKMCILITGSENFDNPETDFDISTNMLTSISFISEEGYHVEFGGITFSASSATGYPMFEL